MTFSQGDIHNHLRGARQGDARERYVFIVAVKLSIEFGNNLNKKSPVKWSFCRIAIADKNVKIAYRLQACNEPARSVNPFCELAVPGMRALLLVFVLSMYSFRPLDNLLSTQQL